AAVVGGVRHLARARQLTAADLVQDLAGLFLAEVVDAFALVRGEEEERVARDLGRDEQRLEAGDERVAPERRGVPGPAGGDAAPTFPEDRQRLEVGDGLLQFPVERLVAGDDPR